MYNVCTKSVRYLYKDGYSVCVCTQCVRMAVHVQCTVLYTTANVGKITYFSAVRADSCSRKMAREAVSSRCSLSSFSSLSLSLAPACWTSRPNLCLSSSCWLSIVRCCSATPCSSHSSLCQQQWREGRRNKLVYKMATEMHDYTTFFTQLRIYIHVHLPWGCWVVFGGSCYVL